MGINMQCQQHSSTKWPYNCDTEVKIIRLWGPLTMKMALDWLECARPGRRHQGGISDLAGK